MSESHANHNHADHTHDQKAVSEPTLNPPLYAEKEKKFHFKKQKVKDELGNEVKRPPVTLTAPYPTFHGLIAALEDPKVANLVLDLVEDAVTDQIRVQVTDEDKPVNRQSELDLTKLTLSYIANLPKTERTGGGIPKDTWEEFESDYNTVMTKVLGKEKEEKVAKQAKIFVGRLNAVRSEKNILKFMQGQLSMWITNTESQDDFNEVYVYLDGRISTLLNKDSQAQLEALM